MVFTPLWSLVLVNKSEVLPKSLEKQSSGCQCWERGEHIDQVSKQHRAHGNISYPALCIPSSGETNLAVSHSSKRYIWPRPKFKPHGNTFIKPH